MDAVRSAGASVKGYVSEQVAAVKAFNKREALLQGVNLGDHACLHNGIIAASTGRAWHRHKGAFTSGGGDQHLAEVAVHGVVCMQG